MQSNQTYSMTMQEWSFRTHLIGICPRFILIETLTCRWDTLLTTLSPTVCLLSSSQITTSKVWRTHSGLTWATTWNRSSSPTVTSRIPWLQGRRTTCSFGLTTSRLYSSALIVSQPLKQIQELRDEVRTEISNGGNAFALDIQLPKYENLPFYKEWLPLNALMIVRYFRKKTFWFIFE